MLRRVGDVHAHATRSARGGIHVGMGDHRSVGYRVPNEWAGMGEEERAVGSLAAFKRRSREGSLWGYGVFVCQVSGCAVCGGPVFNLAVLALIFRRGNPFLWIRLEYMRIQVIRMPFGLPLK